MKTARIPFLIAALASIAACAGPESQAAKGPMAEDLVCKYNGDLACVLVPMTAESPSYDYKGKTYYFCSPKCKADFIKDPEKYIPLAGK